jgi:hypothetical protein
MGTDQMTADGLRLLISSTPLWQNPNPTYPLPVHVQVVYTVLGRSNNRWQTILNSTNDLYAARDAMHAANTSGLYDRLVITEGQSVNRAPAVGWNTIECALPVYQASFEELMQDMKEKAANNNPAQLPKHAFLVGQKQSRNSLLALACLLAALTQSPLILAAIGCIALADAYLMSGDTPISVDQAALFNTTRDWAYAAVNGLILLVVLFS